MSETDRATRTASPVHRDSGAPERSRDVAGTVVASPAVQVTAGTAVAVSALAAGPSPALDVQVALVVATAFDDCVDEGAAAARLFAGRGRGDVANAAASSLDADSALRAVSPVAFRGSAGTLALAAGALSLNFALAVVLHLRGRFSGNGAESNAPASAWWAALGAARCPSLAHTAFAVLMQGLLLEAALTLAAPNDTQPGAIDAAVSVAGIALAAGVTATRVWALRDPARSVGAHTRPYAALRRRLAAWGAVARAALPAAYWCAATPSGKVTENDASAAAALPFAGHGKRMLGSLLSAARRADDSTDVGEPGSGWATATLVISLPAGKRAAVAALVALAARGALRCAHALAIVAALHAATALVVLWRAPFRRGTDNAVAALVDALTAGVAGALLGGADASTVEGLVAACGAVGVVAAVVALALRVLEPPPEPVSPEDIIKRNPLRSRGTNKPPTAAS